MPIININNRELNEQTVMEIGKFTILWNIFEKEKCENDCSTDKLAKLVSRRNTNINWQNLATTLTERRDLYNEDTPRYINERLSLGRGIKEIEKICIRDFINSSGRTSLIGGLLAIYRIRNNMFHGLKDWTELDSQFELFVKLNEFLTYAIREL